MPRQRRQLSESGVHHVMMRGINRDALFLEDADRQRFLDDLGRAGVLSGCRVLAYCLMPNHVHLLVRTGEEPLGEAMKRVGVRYSGWFNRKYGRAGHLFQDRFRSRPVDTDAYFTAALRYIWNNPVEAGMVGRPEDYPWSSRHLLGRVHPVVDEAALRQLIDLPLAIEADPAPAVLTGRRGRPSRFSGDEADALMLHVRGADGSTPFGCLDTSEQLRVIGELRMRSMPYDQIAGLTGLSASTIRRMQASGPVAAEAASGG